jgi:hypothetical protein
MVLVHLYYSNVQFGDFLGRVIGSYTRFAGGGFIFISGMSIGIIFLPRARDPKRRTSTYFQLWRRAFYILGIQYISALVVLLLNILCGLPIPQLERADLMKNVLLLRVGGDLLPFYIIMIALSPFFLEVIRRGWTGLLVALALAGFIFGQWHPWFGALAGHDSFPPILWQAIFISGVVFATIWPKYDALAIRWKIVTAALAWTVAALLFNSEYSSDFGWRHINLFMSFRKVPLSDGEAVRYLSMILGIITVSDLLWPILGGTAVAEFVQTLGRKSLPVYVAHLWLVVGVSWLAGTWWWMGAWQITLAIASVLVLWFFALLLDLRASLRPARAGAMQVAGAQA